MSGLTAAARNLGKETQTLDFISSIVAGLLLGLGIDWLASTRPVFTIIGIVLGFVSGFIKMWSISASLEEQAESRRREAQTRPLRQGAPQGIAMRGQPTSHQDHPQEEPAPGGRTEERRGA